MTNKLNLPPDQAGYAVLDAGNEVVRVQLAGGAGRYRRDILNASKMANVTWTLGPEEYDYFEMFYRVMTLRAGEPFLIDLIIGESGLTQHEARFIPGSKQLQSQRGLTYVVTAQLEVTPKQYDYAYEDSLIVLLSAYTDFDSSLEVINQLEQLVNEDLPNAWG
jgi:hypothetical protein